GASNRIYHLSLHDALPISGWRGGADSAKVLKRPRDSGAGGHAGVAQLVARHLAKVKVAGSSPVARSERGRRGYRGLRPRWGGREARQRPAKPCTRVQRSEERRVGKEWRSRWAPYQ